MNAYELADQVEMWGEDLLALNMKGGIPVIEGAKLIRQQADRIAELEKQVKNLDEYASCYAIQLQTKPAPEGLIDPKSYYIGYEDGKKAPQIKPENVWTSCVACGQRVTADSIHTCSPQTKPLSDDEITDVFVTCLLPNGEFDEHEFARAIEERHGIK